jgi:hypothetical protein
VVKTSDKENYARERLLLIRSLCATIQPKRHAVGLKQLIEDCDGAADQHSAARTDTRFFAWQLY